MRRNLYAVAFLLLFATSVQVNAQPTGTPQSTTAQSTKPKVEDSVKQSLAQGNYQEVLVEFDDTVIQTGAAKMRKLANVEHDNPETLNFKASEYKKLKGSAMAGMATAEHEKLIEYSHLPLTFVRLKTVAALNALLAEPRVKAIHVNGIKYPVLDSVSAGYVNQPAVNARGFAGTGAAVAVIDTGVNYTQADFGCTAPGVPAGCKVAYYANIADSSTALDSSGHGTNVSGIVAGVAPGAKIVALNVFGANSFTSDALILSAMNYAIALQPTYKIASINLSLGDNINHGDGFDLGNSSLSCVNTPYYTAYFNAWNAGITVVAAAGNNGLSNGVNSPACTYGGIAVGAVYDSTHGATSYSICSDPSGSADQTACFTDLPPTSSTAYTYVMAPGVNITAGGATYSGTSQATPFVAAAYALKFAAIPNPSSAQLPFYFSSWADQWAQIPATRAGYTGTMQRLDLAQFLTDNYDNFATVYPANNLPSTSNSFKFSTENVFDTKEAGEPSHAGNAGGHSAWIAFTPLVTSLMEIDTHLSGFDTLLAVYTGSSVSALTQVAANDDDGSAGGTSSVTFQAQAGTTYHVAVDGKNGVSGIFILNGLYLSTDLSLSMTASGSSPTSSMYTLQVNNAGPGNATNVKVTVNLPSGATFNSASAAGCTGTGNVVTCLLGTINALSSSSLTLYSNFAAIGTYVTSATVSSDLTEINPANNSVSVSTLPYNADLSVTMGASEISSTSILYYLNVKNAGPGNATNVKTTIALPTGVTLDPMQTGGCTTSTGNVVTCLLGTINALGSGSVQFYANVVAFGNYTATVSVSSSAIDLNSSNNSTSTQLTVVKYVPPPIETDVPTLPEWGVIILGLLLFFLVQFQDRKRNV